MEQGSQEWLAARVGKLTASRLSEALAKTKTGWGASRANVMAELLTERLTGVPTEKYVNASMQWGTDTEAEARAAYQFEVGKIVEVVGFLPHPTITMSGASPDGLVGTDGLVEIKCPNTATHLETLLGQSVPGKYVLQMQWQMLCAGRIWCDFVSYDPRLPEEMRIFIKRVVRDREQQKDLEREVSIFLEELDDKMAELAKRYPSVREAA